MDQLEAWKHSQWVSSFTNSQIFMNIWGKFAIKITIQLRISIQSSWERCLYDIKATTKQFTKLVQFIYHYQEGWRPTTQKKSIKFKTAMVGLPNHQLPWNKFKAPMTCTWALQSWLWESKYQINTLYNPSSKLPTNWSICAGESMDKRFPTNPSSKLPTNWSICAGRVWIKD